MLHNHVENFIKHYNYTWEQFDLIFEVNSTVKKEEEKIPAGNRGAGAGVLVTSSRFHCSNINDYKPKRLRLNKWWWIPQSGKVKAKNCSKVNSTGFGKWLKIRWLVFPRQKKASNSVSNQVEEVRAQVLGYPWLLRKMLSYMEGRFDVGYYDGDVLKIKLRRKLFSSGEMEIVLDGNEHAWGMQLPMFQGLSNRW